MIQYTSGWIGGPEIIIILIVVLLLFGGRKIPELARGIGKGIREFRKATNESELADDLRDIKEEFNNVKEDVKKLDPSQSIKSKKGPDTSTRKK